MNEFEKDLDRLLNRVSQAGSTVLAKVILWPKTAAATGLCVIALVVVACNIPRSHPDKLPPINEWRLNQMTDAVQKADQRVRSRMGAEAESDGQFRGVFETMRDQTTPPPMPGGPPVSEINP